MECCDLFSELIDTLPGAYIYCVPPLQSEREEEIPTGANEDEDHDLFLNFVATVGGRALLLNYNHRDVIKINKILWGLQCATEDAMPLDSCTVPGNNKYSFDRSHSSNS